MALVFRTRHFVRCLAGCVALAALAAFYPAQLAFGGNNGNGGAVGGVEVTIDGILSNLDKNSLPMLVRARREALAQINGDLNKAAKLRKVSLRKLTERVAEHRQKNPGEPLPDDVRYLAGLQRVQFIFVYPEEKDIVIAGPADGWKVDDRGEVVGATNNLPVLRLDDLAVAFQAISADRGATMSCSIDPTQEGVQKLNAFLKTQKTFNDGVKDKIEEALGKQTITIKGVAATTRFAHTMLVADYRMKRYAMGLETSPVKGMPSYLELMQKSAAKPTGDLTPRWWLAPDYQPLLTDGEGLAWELRPGMKCMTEDEHRDADGNVRGTGRANALAKKWSEAFSSHYNDLAAKDAVFAELRNCIDLAVTAAIIVKEDLGKKSGLDLAFFTDGQQLMPDALAAPKFVETEVSLAKKQREWIITASGGVQFNSMQLANQAEKNAKLGSARTGANGTSKLWWWD